MKNEHEIFANDAGYTCFFFESVKFYEISDKEWIEQNYRILVKAESDSVNISSGCTPTNGLPTAVETIVLVKKGVYSCVQIANIPGKASVHGPNKITQNTMTYFI